MQDIQAFCDKDVFIHIPIMLAYTHTGYTYQSCLHTRTQERASDDRSTKPIRERLTEIRVLAQDEDDIGARVSRGHLAMDSLKDAKVVCAHAQKRIDELNIVVVQLCKRKTLICTKKDTHLRRVCCNSSTASARVMCVHLSSSLNTRFLPLNECMYKLDDVTAAECICTSIFRLLLSVHLYYPGGVCLQAFA
jgi:hypothetical protein